MCVGKLISPSIANNLPTLLGKSAVEQLTQERDHLSVWG